MNNLKIIIELSNNRNNECVHYSVNTRYYRSSMYYISSS